MSAKSRISKAIEERAQALARAKSFEALMPKSFLEGFRIAVHRLAGGQSCTEKDMEYAWRESQTLKTMRLLLGGKS